MKKITIILIDDHKLIRQAWCFILNNDPRFSIVAESGNAEEGIEFCKQLRPDIALLDINLPGISGLEAVPLIRKYAPTTKIVGVSMHNQSAYAKKMMQIGASGYITKSSSQREMFKALQDVYTGKKYLCEEIKNALAKELVQNDGNQVRSEELSLREMEISKLVCKGMSSKEIALAIFISVKTVEVHRYNILRKLKLKNAAELANYVNKNASVFG